MQPSRALCASGGIPNQLTLAVSHNVHAFKVERPSFDTPLLYSYSLYSRQAHYSRAFAHANLKSN